MNKSLLSSNQETWRTPRKELAIVSRVADDGLIHLDPCASMNKKHWFATHNLTNEDDGLGYEWSDFGEGLVYVNPPYGRKIPIWVNKIVSQPKSEIILLCPARPGSKWWKNSWTSSNAYCFYRPRIRFVGGKEVAPFPSAFFYFGSDPYKFCFVFRRYGIVGVLHERIT